VTHETWALSGETTISNRTESLIEGGDEEVVMVIGSGDVFTEELADALDAARRRGVSVVLGAIARSDDATITVVSVVDPDDGSDDRERARDAIEEAAAATGQSAVERELLEGDDVAQRILAETENHDITIVGATRQSRVRQIVFGAIPERIGRRAQNITIMAKRRTGTTARLVGKPRQWVGGD
jgi:nucleotide-binding universal stress UspA family protein